MVKKRWRCRHRRHRWPHFRCWGRMVMMPDGYCHRHHGTCSHRQYDQLERTWTLRKQRDWAGKIR